MRDLSEQELGQVYGAGHCYPDKDKGYKTPEPKRPHPEREKKYDDCKKEPDYGCKPPPKPPSCQPKPPVCHYG